LPSCPTIAFVDMIDTDQFSESRWDDQPLIAHRTRNHLDEMG
jgi:hypothetical protein